MENKQIKQVLIDCPVCGVRHYVHTSSNGHNSWFNVGDIKAIMYTVKKSDAITGKISQETK